MSGTEKAYDNEALTRRRVPGRISYLSRVSATGQRPRTRPNVVGKQDCRWRVQTAHAAVMEALRSETDAFRPEHLAGADHSRSGAGCDLQLGCARNEIHRAHAP